MTSSKSSDSPEDAWGKAMGAAQQGDAATYRALLADIILWLRRYYRRRLPPAMVEDAIQDVLLAIHEKRHTYDPARPFGPWLAAIARYKWIDRLRGLKADAFEPLDETLQAADQSDGIVASSALRRLLGSLKPAQADVIRLVKIEGYSIEEASQATGQSVPLVKVNIHRGIKRLTDRLRKTDDAD